MAIATGSKVWLITGSSRGLGRAFAEAVLEAGHRVVATARSPQQLAEVVAKYGDRVRAVALDVTDETQAQRAVGTAIESFGSLDVLVNNAGYGNVGPVEDTPLGDFRAQIETNLFGVIIITKAVLPYFRGRKAGHIIQLSSIGGRIGPVGRAAYAAAKFGVEGFSESLHREVDPLGIKVTIVEPGGFRTDLQARPRNFGKDARTTIPRLAPWRDASAILTASNRAIPPKPRRRFCTLLRSAIRPCACYWEPTRITWLSRLPFRNWSRTESGRISASPPTTRRRRISHRVSSGFPPMLVNS